jgi:hypothetical protein
VAKSHKPWTLILLYIFSRTTTRPCPPIQPMWLCQVQNNYFLPLLIFIFIFLKTLLKGLKHVTFNGCNACDMCEGKVTMFIQV